jgi:hypothetical protein
MRHSGPDGPVPVSVRLSTRAAVPVPALAVALVSALLAMPAPVSATVPFPTAPPAQSPGPMSGIHTSAPPPTSYFESLTGGPDAVNLSGWSIDPDTVGPNDVDVWIDGHFAGTTVAGNERDDVGESFPTSGADHGFSVSLPAVAGTHSVCAYAINVASGRSNRRLKCRTVTVGGNPTGNFESLTRVGSGVTASGWALDPDTTDSIAVHVYVDGVWTVAATADADRPDVGSSFPGYGSLHGFGVPLTVSAGTHSVCVYAINSGAGNSNKRLGCRSI